VGAPRRVREGITDVVVRRPPPTLADASEQAYQCYDPQRAVWSVVHRVLLLWWGSVRGRATWPGASAVGVAWWHGAQDTGGVPIVKRFGETTHASQEGRHSPGRGAQDAQEATALRARPCGGPCVACWGYTA